MAVPSTPDKPLPLPSFPLSPPPRRGISARPLKGKVNGRRWTLPGCSPRLRVKAGHGSAGWRRWRRKNRRRWRRRLPGGWKQQARKEKSSTLAARPFSLEQPIRIPLQSPRWWTNLHNHTKLVCFCRFFLFLFFFFPPELSLSSVSHCDSPILSHIVCSPPKSVKASHSQLRQHWQLAAHTHPPVEEER